MSRIYIHHDPIPIGYQALIEMFQLPVTPFYRESYVIAKGTPSTQINNGKEIHYYQKHYLPKDPLNPFSQIEFALKHEGMHLELFSLLFQKIEKSAVENYIASYPTGKTARKIWFLYEYLTEDVLSLENAQGGSYVPLLDPDQYFTASPVRSKRHLIFNNLLGSKEFCPLIRRTDFITRYEEKDLSKVAKGVINGFDPVVIARAVNYMYVKETMSSFEIEREKPNPSRTRRFVELLKHADHFGPMDKKRLVELQNSVVDPRFANKDYRDFQNYIGTEGRLDRYGFDVDYIPPKPEDVPGMMDGLISSLEKMFGSGVHPIVIAAAIGFGFVFIHPFEDGNGRLHRFLIHYVFSRTGFVPHGVIFPISAVILKDLKKYDAVLESFSAPLLRMIPAYTFNDAGELTVKGDTALYYKYTDFTPFAEYLFTCVEKTILSDFKDELKYLVSYDKVKTQLQRVVDMPDKKIHLFIQLTMQNGGKLSPKKRQDHFSMLTDGEVSQMEKAVQEQLGDQLYPEAGDQC